MYQQLYHVFQVSGILPAKPVTSFAHFGLEQNLIKAIRKAGYTQPTPIQAQVSEVIVYLKSGHG